MTTAAAELHSQIITDPPEVIETDVAIFGSGMGGGTRAYALRDTRVNAPIVGQGDFLPFDRENRLLDVDRRPGPL